VQQSRHLKLAVGATDQAGPTHDTPIGVTPVDAELLGESARMFGHDLRNMLAVIHAQVELLSMDSHDPEVSRRLDSVAEMALGASRLAVELMALGRVGTPVPQRLDLLAQVQTVARMFRCRLPADCRLIVESSDEPWIMADRGRFDMMLLNLLVNAAEAVPHNKPATIRVGVGSEPDGLAVLTVSDDGCGIPKSHLDNVWDLGVTSKTTGTGVGLASVRRFANHARGQVSLSSQPGCGTKVRLTLPRVSRSASAG